MARASVFKWAFLEAERTVHNQTKVPRLQFGISASTSGPVSITFEKKVSGGTNPAGNNGYIAFGAPVTVEGEWNSYVSDTSVTDEAARGQQISYAIRATLTDGTSERVRLNLRDSVIPAFFYTLPLEATGYIIRRSSASALSVTLTGWKGRYYKDVYLNYRPASSSEMLAVKARDVINDGSEVIAQFLVPDIATEDTWLNAITVTLPELCSEPGSAYTVAKLWGTISAVKMPLAPIVGPVQTPWPIERADCRVTWTPNHPDYSDQTAAQVEWTDPDGNVTTSDVTGSTTSYTRTAAFDKVGRWMLRVRTKGLSSSWGEWSSFVAVNVAVTPVVSVSGSSNVVNLPATFAWSVAVGSARLAEQSVAITSPSGQVVYSSSPGAKVRSISLNPADVTFRNDTDYTITVTARSESGLIGQGRFSFRVSWVPPTAPTVHVLNNPTNHPPLCARVSVAPAAGVKVSSCVIERVQGGERTTLASMVSFSSTVSVYDALPPLNVSYAYEVTLKALSGASTVVYASNVLDSDGMEAYNFGTNAGTCVPLGLEASASESVERGGETFHFALGAGTEPLPTFYPDGDMDVSGSKSYSVHGAEAYEALRRAVRGTTGALCWYRDACGHRAFGHASWQLSYSAQEYDLFKVSCDFIECVWEEPHGSV